MTMTDQILNNNIEQDNKKICFADISPIRDCLDGCDKCLGYYIFNELEAYSICQCTCHETLLTIDDIKPIILLHQKDKYSKKYQRYSGISINKPTIFDVIDELFTKQRIKEVIMNVK
jgi:hypothetical protein